MYSPRVRNKTPVEYEFPYVPYTIQQSLMKSLYTVIENKGIGIFESPTGTGKSLTLTCAALRWLEDHEALVYHDLQHHMQDMKTEIKKIETAGAAENDWISEQFAVMQQREKLAELQKLNMSLENYQKQLLELKKRVTTSPSNEKLSSRKSNEQQLQQSDDDDDGGNESNDAKHINHEDKYRNVQIFFCSRTHSQLAQVIREVKRTAYGRKIRCISLASRQQLCVNPDVRHLPSGLLNERCLDMAHSTSSTKSDDGSSEKIAKLGRHSKCPFKTTGNVQKLSDIALMDLHDIEEFVSEGERQKACPYYAARTATQMAQLVMLPYQMLLHRRTRIQSGIDLRGAVVIIDEAHNLLDTIAQLHSCEVNLEQLIVAQRQIVVYKQRYMNRFSSGNLLRINQLIFVIKRLIKLLQPNTGGQDVKCCVRFLRSYELTAEGEFFNIDLFQLVEFCESNRLAQKLQKIVVVEETESIVNENYSPTTALLRRMEENRKQSKQKSKKPTPNHAKQDEVVTKSQIEKLKTLPQASALRPLIAFLNGLTEKAEDGRVLICVNASGDVAQNYFKYILLNPSEHFKDILDEARAVIIAGGTLQPTAELTQQLFRFSGDRVQEFTYGHVVPADAVLPFVVRCGPSGQQMLFNYTQRTSEQMLSELGMIFQNICNVVPEGLVCFLPSYDYLDTVFAYLEKSGVLERMSAKKVIFRETRATAKGQSVEQLLTDYATAIRKGKGAFLLSVVGGKLSEGLNFADELGRCVIVVGMPYPNRQSPELVERMKYLDNIMGVGTGAEYYENLCMKAVNQCIGRSVRHIRDYACVLLLDERYSSERIQKKLPHWIARSIQIASNFGAVQSATAKFFKQKRLIEVAT